MRNTSQALTQKTADFQRILADAMRVGAGILAQIGERERAADELQTRIALHAKLYRDLDSEVRRNDLLAALIDGVRSAQEWKIRARLLHARMRVRVTMG